MLVFNFLKTSNSFSNTVFRQYLSKQVAPEPLIVFRIFFGAMMIFSVCRFYVLGWISDHFINPKFHFKYFGFEWVSVLPPTYMYVIHAAMLLGAMGIMLGLWYRFSTILFFVTFTYCELIDITYYLNHYYFVSIIGFMLIFMPANIGFSIDAALRKIPKTGIQNWSIFTLKVLVGIVYFYAGLAKINHTWLIEAMPMRIWIPAHKEMPILGPLFGWYYTPWIFSWAGMLYDCTIVLFLSIKKTSVWAYLSVIVFHSLTGLLFQIGIFPLVMMAAALIFFPASFHRKVLNLIISPFAKQTSEHFYFTQNHSLIKKWKMALLLAFIGFQLIFPWRYLLYPGNLFWTEEGYRFGWRVMLMEKAGTAIFRIKEEGNDKTFWVDNSEFLSPHQEKQMAMQADLILQYAHLLKKHYENLGVKVAAVYADVFVTLNAKPSKRYINPNLDLTTLKDSFKPKTWILHDAQSQP